MRTLRVSLYPLQKGLPVGAQPKFVGIFPGPFYDIARLNGDHGDLSGHMATQGRRVQWAYLGVRVETLVGDRVPSFVFTLIDRSAFLQFLLSSLEKVGKYQI